MALFSHVHVQLDSLVVAMDNANHVLKIVQPVQTDWDCARHAIQDFC